MDEVTVSGVCTLKDILFTFQSILEIPSIGSKGTETSAASGSIKDGVYAEHSIIERPIGVQLALVEAEAYDIVM